MNNLNTIFTEKLPKPAKEIRPVVTAPPPVQAIEAPKTATKRATRSDKCHDIKFPVTPNMRAELIRRAARNKVKETRYCTLLLNKALSYTMTSIPQYEYIDSVSFMHVKPTAIPYEKILNMRIELKISRREAVYRLIRFMLEKEGVRI